MRATTKALMCLSIVCAGCLFEENKNHVAAPRFFSMRMACSGPVGGGGTVDIEVNYLDIPGSVDLTVTAEDDPDGHVVLRTAQLVLGEYGGEPPVSPPGPFSIGPDSTVLTLTPQTKQFVMFGTKTVSSYIVRISYDLVTPGNARIVASTTATIPRPGETYDHREECPVTVAASPTTLYVDDDAPAGGDGSSWGEAHRSLQDALEAARDPASAAAEIRVAAGRYSPDRGSGIAAGDRTATFRLVPGVLVRGGFAGLGDPANPDRQVDVGSPAIQPQDTVLDGDLLGNDTDRLSDPGSFDDNALHVVTSDASLAVLENLVVRGGTADTDGAGILASGGSLEIRLCLVRDNHADGDGGGLFAGAPVVARDTLFVGNDATNGGAIRSDGVRLVVVGGSLSSNQATGAGGGLSARGGTPVLSHLLVQDSFLGGGLHFDGVADAKVLNCLVAANGTGIVADGSNVRIVHVTFLSNDPDLDALGGSGADVSNSILWSLVGGGDRIAIDASTVALDHSIVQDLGDLEAMLGGLVADSTVVGDDPLVDDFGRLGALSPAIGGADASALDVYDAEPDLDGLKFQDRNGKDRTAPFDIGAHEA